MQWDLLGACKRGLGKRGGEPAPGAHCRQNVGIQIQERDIGVGQEEKVGPGEGWSWIQEGEKLTKRPEKNPFFSLILVFFPRICLEFDPALVPSWMGTWDGNCGWKTLKERSRRRNPKAGMFCPVQSKPKHLQVLWEPRAVGRFPHSHISVGKGEERMELENPFPGEFQGLLSLIIPIIVHFGWKPHRELDFGDVPNPKTSFTQHFLDFLLGMCPVWGSPSAAKYS